MKKILTALLFACCASAYAQTAADLLNKSGNTDNVTTFGMGYDMKMYSPLSAPPTKWATCRSRPSTTA